MNSFQTIKQVVGVGGVKAMHGLLTVVYLPVDCGGGCRCKRICMTNYGGISCSLLNKVAFLNSVQTIKQVVGMGGVKGYA